MTDPEDSLPPGLEERSEQIAALAWFLAIGVVLFALAVLYNIFV